MSRVREFNSTRGKNLSDNYSQLDHTSRVGTFDYNSGGLRQSQSSAFLRKEKVPVCVNCVNQKLDRERRDRARKQREKESKEIKEVGIINQKEIDKMEKERGRMIRQAETYNQRAAKRMLNTVKSDKNIDSHYIKEAEKRELELRELEAKIGELKREKELRYREELQKQVEEEKERKKMEKVEKTKVKPDEGIIKPKGDNSYLKKYQKDLQRQIEQDKRRKQQEKKYELKLSQQELECRELQYANSDKNKSHNKKQINPEIFEQAKQKQIRMKKEKEQQRQLKQKQRQIEAKKSKDEYQKQLKKELAKMKNYSIELSYQITQKKHQDERTRNEDTRESRTHLYAEELVESKKQECGECHHSVKQTYLTYV